LPTGPDAAATAKDILLWARGKRIALTRVKVGEVELDIAADLALAPTAPSLTSPRPEADPYETFGGPQLAKLREQEAEDKRRGDSTVIEDD
jgi:hypothetical protein